MGCRSASFSTRAWWPCCALRMFWFSALQQCSSRAQPCLPPEGRYRKRASRDPMFAPSPLPRSLEASFRDIASSKAATRASATRDVVRYALLSDATRLRAIPLLERLLRDDEASVVRAEAAVALAD